MAGKAETGLRYAYDAWNRLVAVKNSAGTTTLETFKYDGLSRRVSATIGGTTTDLYYSAGWQVLEEKVGSATTARYVWSPVYVDALVLRDRDTDANGSLDERLWGQQDANWNVTALVDGTGAVVERYAYDPFGAVTIYGPAWGAVRASSSYDWVYLHQGGRLDGVTGAYYFRNRDYSPTLGRWTSLDSIRYTAGDVNLYRSRENQPTRFLDPSGFANVEIWLFDKTTQLSPYYAGHLDLVLLDERSCRAVMYGGRGPGLAALPTLVSPNVFVYGSWIRGKRDPDTVGTWTTPQGLPKQRPRDATLGMGVRNWLPLSGGVNFDVEMAKLDRVYQRLKQIQRYNLVWGPNSGTYLHKLLLHAGYGDNGNLRNQLFDRAPGWSYTGPYEYGGIHYDEWGTERAAAGSMAPPGPIDYGPTDIDGLFVYPPASGGYWDAGGNWVPPGRPPEPTPRDPRWEDFDPNDF